MATTIINNDSKIMQTINKGKKYIYHDYKNMLITQIMRVTKQCTYSHNIPYCALWYVP